MGITRDAWPVLGPILFLALVSVQFTALIGGWWWAASIPLAILSLFSLWFFRDPQRLIPDGEEVITAPGDGKVLEIVPIKHDEFIGGEAKRVSIFLSVFNVHVNRVPASGLVREVKRFPGKFLIAYDPRATEENNRLRIDIDSKRGRLRCVQVTGAIARRIVCHLQAGQRIERGDRYGMIRFGSRMDLIIPANAAVKIKQGEVVHGGETVIATW